jgi:FkbM family methyltransferase
MRTRLARLANRLYDHAPTLYIALYGVYKTWSDRHERSLLASIMRPGMTALDVGAHIGTYTRFLAGLVGPTGRVVAFEPEPRNFANLKHAVVRFPQVRVVNAAVAERNGLIKLFVADDLNVDHHTYQTRDRRTIEVDAFSLDGFMKPGERVDLIKLDIQGGECSALRGAQRLLQDNRDVQLLLECWPFGLKQAGSSAEELVTILRSQRFNVRVISRSAQRVEDIAVDPTEYANLLASRH